MSSKENAVSVENLNLDEDSEKNEDVEDVSIREVVNLNAAEVDKVY